MASDTDRKVFDKRDSSLLGLFQKGDSLEDFLEEIENPEDVSVRIEKIDERQNSQTGVGAWTESEYQVIAEYSSQETEALYRGNTETVRNSGNNGIPYMDRLNGERSEIISELWEMSDEPVYEALDILRDTGERVRERIRDELPDNSVDEEVEYIWEEGLTDRKAFNSAVIGEEGVWTVEDDPDYGFLVDALDGTSGARNGDFPWLTTAVTVLEDVEVESNRLTGSPIGSYIRQIDGNGAEFFSWDGEASIDGEVRFTDVYPEHPVPGTVEGTEIGPRTVGSFHELDSERKGLVSAYGAKKGRRPVRESFLEPLEDLSDNVRVSLTGGSYTGASVGWGKTLVAGEPKPTLPTEAAGEIFARAMGAAASDIYGESNDTISAEGGEDGPKRTYTSIVAANQDIHEEVLEAVNVESLEDEENFGDEFETYNRLR